MANFFKQYGVYLAIFSAGLVIQALAVWFDAFEMLYQYSRMHEDLELDELFMLFVTGCLTMAGLFAAYGAELRAEIARRRAAESQAATLARHDPLTGLANRRFFNEELLDRIARARWQGREMYVLMLDLDRFKPINDAKGHAAGDRVLQAVADRIKATCPEDAVIARLGGDEFAIVACQPRESVEQASHLARALLEKISEPIAIPEGPVEISGSIGIAALEEGVSASELTLRADQAMYKAKSEGRATMAFFDQRLERQVRERSELETDMRRALRAGEFEPFFQPQIDLLTGRVSGFEALARWRHPARGVIGPEAFIPIAEEGGLINPLSWSVLRAACREAARWGDVTVTLSFNLAPIQFAERSVVQALADVLEETGLPGERLELEMTETAVIHDHGTARKIMTELKALGVRFALDDFGVGYSSVTSLHQMPFDKVKIDRSFITGAAHDPRRDNIVRAILGLGHRLGLVVTAEGVETAEELDWLRSMGCDQGQGFYFARPMPAHEAMWYLDAREEQCAAEAGAERFACGPFVAAQPG